MAYFNLQLFEADGHLNFDTRVDEKGFSSGISKLGGIAKGGLAVLGASVAGITAAFAGMSKAALGSVASLEQNVGGVETLFKENAKTVIENANNAYKTAACQPMSTCRVSPVFPHHYYRAWPGTRQKRQR